MYPMTLSQIVQKVEKGCFLSNRIIIYLSLLLLYCIRNSPSLFLIKNINNIGFPLESIYIANNLMFSNFGLSEGFIHSIISPANAALILPPGIYILIKLFSLTSVFSIVLFNFLVQLIVPIFFYELLRTRTNTIIAFFFAVFSVFFMTDASWWAPDFIIQVLMLPIFFFFVYQDGKYLNRYSTLFLLGLPTGFLIILKHNIGIFFCIVCATILLFQCIKPLQIETKKNLLNKVFTTIVFFGFFIFGIIFGLRLPNADEYIYYLVPFFLFLILLWCFLVRRNQVFDIRATLTKVIPFGAGAAILPVSVFFWFGSQIGYGNYAYSLFGMGFQYLKIWDRGITGVIELYFTPLNGSISSLLLSPIFLILFILPFVVNCYGLYCIYQQSKKPQEISDNKIYSVVAIGILSIFMFFPLEGFHILTTKLFIYFFVLFTLMLVFSPSLIKYATYLAILIGIFAACIIGITFMSTLSTPSDTGVSELKTSIGIPVSKGITGELKNQIVLIDGTIHGEPYYIIDGSGAGLFYLASIIPNKYPQYYIEMRPGIMDQEVTGKILQDISGMNYVIVRTVDYNNPHDPKMGIIIRYLKEHFTIKGTYSVSNTRNTGISSDMGFLILERTK